MTREEAIELVCYGDWLNILMPHLGDDDINRLAEAMCIIGNALRPVSRERVEKVSDKLKVGDEVQAKITELDYDRKRASLSIKALLQEEAAEEAPVEE